MSDAIVVETDEGTLKLRVTRDAAGKIERATFTVYEHDGAREGTLDAKGARVVEAALCPPDRGTA